MKLVQPRTILAAIMVWYVAHALAAGGDAIPRSPSTVPTGVIIDGDALQRKGCRGDNWCMTWAADDNLYTMMDDADGRWDPPYQGHSDYWYK